MSEVAKKLAQVQAKLYVPKDRDNKFGGFSYRNAEDILRAVKPLLIEQGLVVVLSDDMKAVTGTDGTRYYVQATARIIDTETDDEIIATASAREPNERKGMDTAQVTGSSTSYARKYALCGLFAIDDSADDPDSQDNRASRATTQTLKKVVARADELGVSTEHVSNIVSRIFHVQRSTEMTEEQAQDLLANIDKYAGIVNG